MPPSAPAPEDLAATPATWVGATAGVGYRLAPASADIPPAIGMSIATMVGHRYATVAGRLELGVEGGFVYDRYARTVEVPADPARGQAQPFDTVRATSHYDFFASQVAAARLGRYRPWIAAGAGVALGYFLTREPGLDPGESRLVRPLGHAGAGLDVEVVPQTDLGLRLGYMHVWRKPTFVSATGERLQVFGDRLLAHLTLRYRF